jgi:hypothetical protein
MAAPPFPGHSANLALKQKEVHMISVSIDPGRDTPAFLIKDTIRTTELLTEST